MQLDNAVPKIVLDLARTERSLDELSLEHLEGE